MRYICKQIQSIDPEKTLVDSEFVINELKRQIVLQLIDKLPFEITTEHGIFNNNTIVTVALDAYIETEEEFIERYKKTHLNE